jgi:excisionase family DNA binding protein
MDELTAAQAANLTGLSERTIRRKIASGVLPARRLGRNRFAIKVADLQVRHPWEALAARVEALEQRLDRLEASVQLVLQAGRPASPLAEDVPLIGAEIQQLFAQLAYETARLARSLPQESPAGSPLASIPPAAGAKATALPDEPPPAEERDRAV